MSHAQHTARCRRLSDDIERIEEDIADLSEQDRPDLPEIGEEIDELDIMRDRLVEERSHLHSAGECPAFAEGGAAAA